MGAEFLKVRCISGSEEQLIQNLGFIDGFNGFACLSHLSAELVFHKQQ